MHSCRGDSPAIDRIVAGAPRTEAWPEETSSFRKFVLGNLRPIGRYGVGQPRSRKLKSLPNDDCPREVPRHAAPVGGQHREAGHGTPWPLPRPWFSRWDPKAVRNRRPPTEQLGQPSVQSGQNMKVVDDELGSTPEEVPAVRRCRLQFSNWYSVSTRTQGSARTLPGDGRHLCRVEVLFGFEGGASRAWRASSGVPTGWVAVTTSFLSSAPGGAAPKEESTLGTRFSTTKPWAGCLRSKPLTGNARAVGRRLGRRPGRGPRFWSQVSC